MNEYERLTSYMQVGNEVVQVVPQRKQRIQAYIDRLFDLEDKIESGELSDRKEVAADIFSKVYTAVKEAVNESIYVNVSPINGCPVLHSGDFKTMFERALKSICEEYGVTITDEE